MKKHIFIASGLIITFISPVISYYIPENNDIAGITASLFALLMIPSGVITIYSIKRLDKTETFSSILKKYSYSLLITLFFTLPIFLINKNNPNDYDFYYQESAGQDLLALLTFIIYIFILIVYFKKNFPSVYENEKIENKKIRKIIFDSIYYISFGFSTLFLLLLFSCDSDPIMFLFSIISVIGIILVTLIDLITKLIKKDKKWIKFQSLALLSWFIYLFTLFFVVKLYSNNGKCEFFLGPDDSGLVLTFLLITIHSYLIRKNIILPKPKFNFINKYYLRINKKFALIFGVGIICISIVWYIMILDNYDYDYNKDINYRINYGSVANLGNAFNNYEDLIFLHNNICTQNKLDSLINTYKISKIENLFISTYGSEGGIGDCWSGDTLRNSEEKLPWNFTILNTITSLKSLYLDGGFNFIYNINTPSNLEYLSLNYATNKGKINFNYLHNIKTINLYNAKNIEKQLLELDKLISLSLINSEIDIKKLLPIKNKIRFLNLSYSTVYNIGELSEFNNLTVLIINRINNVVFSEKQNIKFLSNLKKLKVLSIERNSINDLSVIEDLQELEELHIKHTYVKNIPQKLIEKKDLTIYK